MGIKGDKLSQDSVITAELIEERLRSIEGITTKKMFGGHGLFHEGKMFGLIDSKGKAFMKADDSNRDDFTSLGAGKHSKMPYYEIPSEIMNDPGKLESWAKRSIAISK